MHTVPKMRVAMQKELLRHDFFCQAVEINLKIHFLLNPARLKTGLHYL